MSTDENSAERKPNRESIERTRPTRTWSLFGLILLGGLVLSLASGAEPEATDAPRPTMRVVFEAMRELIPLSLYFSNGRPMRFCPSQSYSPGPGGGLARFRSLLASS